jgi:hypothetical protein
MLTISSIALGACGVLRGAQSLGAPPMPVESVASGEAEFDRAPAEEAEAPMEPSVGGGETGLRPVSDRLVIRDANLTIVVSDPSESVNEISQMATSMGGFVVQSQVFESRYGQGEIVAKQASITVRVPSERLDEALEQIKGDALEVRNENISGRDVTEEYTDLQSRLRNLEQTEEQLREIMASASETEDVLAVLNQLRSITEEIEVIKGRIQFLEQSSELSSLSVEVLPDVATQPIQIGRWQPQGTLKNAVEALVAAYQWMVDALIWVIVFLVPVALVPLGVLLLLVLIARRFLRRRRERADAESTE